MKKFVCQICGYVYEGEAALTTARNVKLLHPNLPKCAATVPGLLNIS